MSKKGTQYTSPKKRVATPADILALGRQGEPIAHAIRSHYDACKRAIEKADSQKTL